MGPLFYISIMKLLHWIDYLCKSLGFVSALWCIMCLIGFFFFRHDIDMPYYSSLLMKITAIPALAVAGEGADHPNSHLYHFDWGSFLLSFFLILFTGISILGVIIENLL